MKSKHFKKTMIAKWRDMSAKVLHSEELANAKMRPTEDQKSNMEWTPFSDADEPPLPEEWKEHR